jgi:dihydrolipoamide dehydrogenase
LDALPDGVKHKGHARFVDRTRLTIGADVFVQAKAIVIATGAKPFIPKFLGGLEERVLTNETLFELKNLPRSIGVIGAGPLGLELAQALARFGVTVTVFDESETLAALDDHEIASALRAILEKEFAIHLGVKLSARRNGDEIALSWSGESDGKATFDYVLAAGGRPPRLDDLGLEASGLTLDKHGAPRVDPNTMQCENAPIFIAGDADHARPVLHEAQAEGSIAGRNAAAFPHVTPAKRMPPLSIMFTDPAIALVGARPNEDADILSGSASFEDQGRAQARALEGSGCRCLSEPTAAIRTLHLEMPLAGRPTFDATEPCPIKGLILFRCRAVFHAEQATQTDPQSGRHVPNTDAQVVAPAAQVG